MQCLQNGIDRRLVYHIDLKRMPAQPFHWTQSAFFHKLHRLFIRKQTICKISRQKQKQPWKQRKIVRRIKARLCKSKICHQSIPIQSRRKRHNIPSLKSKPAIVYVPRQKKQPEAASYSHRRRKPLQPSVKHLHQQHTGAYERQHAKDNSALRHYRQRHQRNHRTSQKYNDSPPARAAAKRPAKTGQKDKRPANSLLPDIRPLRLIPVPVKLINIDQIPNHVICDHMKQRYAADAVQLFVSFFLLILLQFLPISILSKRHKPILALYLWDVYTKKRALIFRKSSSFFM